MALLENNNPKVLISRRLTNEPETRGFPTLTTQGEDFISEQEKSARSLDERFKEARLIAKQRNRQPLKTQNMF